MICQCPCEVTYCDAVEVVRGLWSEDAVLNGLMPSTADATNKVFEDGNAYNVQVPYAVVRDLGDTARISHGDAMLARRAVRIRIFTASKEDGVQSLISLRQKFSGMCSAAICVETGVVGWARVSKQPSGWVDKGIYMTQLLVQLSMIEEGSL